MENNLSSVIFGAIAGGVVSFAMTWFFRKIDQKREKNVLATGVLAELECNIKSLKTTEEHLKQIIFYLGEKVDKAEDKGKVVSSNSLVSLPKKLVYLESNFSSLGVLGENLAKELITYYHDILTIHKVLQGIRDDEGIVRLSNSKDKESEKTLLYAESVYTFAGKKQKHCEQIITKLNRIIL